MKMKQPDLVTPTDILRAFVSELPSTIRTEICNQLFHFFPGDYDLMQREPFEEIVDFVLAPGGADEFENFYRAVLIIAAFDFIFSREDGLVYLFRSKAEVEDFMAMYRRDIPRMDVGLRIRDYKSAQAGWAMLRQTLDVTWLQEFERRRFLIKKRSEGGAEV
jgi:hypothetical protein